MRLYPYILVAAVMLFMTAPSHASGIERDLVEVGKGKAYYLKFIKVYDAILYSDENAAAASILDDDISKCLLLDYAVDVSSEDFIKAADTVLARQFSESLSEELKDHIATLHRGYLDVAEGDNYSLCYDGRTTETTLSLNGEPLVKIQDPEFARVYFGIWLGQYKPLDTRLRDDLLSGLATGEM